MRKPKERKKGEFFRPVVEVLKQKNGMPTRVKFNSHEYTMGFHSQGVQVLRQQDGLPTKIKYNGQEYALIHKDYINSGKSKVKQKGSS